MDCANTAPGARQPRSGENYKRDEGKGKKKGPLYNGFRAKQSAQRDVLGARARAARRTRRGAQAVRDLLGAAARILKHFICLRNTHRSHYNAGLTYLGGAVAPALVLRGLWWWWWWSPWLIFRPEDFLPPWARSATRADGAASHGPSAR